MGSIQFERARMTQTWNASSSRAMRLFCYLNVEENHGGGLKPVVIANPRRNQTPERPATHHVPPDSRAVFLRASDPAGFTVEDYIEEVRASPSKQSWQWKRWGSEREQTWASLYFLALFLSFFFIFLLFIYGRFNLIIEAPFGNEFRD